MNRRIVHLTLLSSLVLFGCAKSVDLNLSCDVVDSASGKPEIRTYLIRNSSWAGTKCSITDERITCAASTAKESNFLELDRISGTINHSFSANGEEGEYKGTCEKIDASKF